MEAWESSFREKSRRRSSAAQARSFVTWSLYMLALLVLVAGVLKVLDL